MSDTVTEIAEDEVVPFTEGDREIAYRSEAAAQVGPGATGRPAVVAARRRHRPPQGGRRPRPDRSR